MNCIEGCTSRYGPDSAIRRFYVAVTYKSQRPLWADSVDRCSAGVALCTSALHRCMKTPQELQVWQMATATGLYTLLMLTHLGLNTLLMLQYQYQHTAIAHDVTNPAASVSL